MARTHTAAVVGFGHSRVLRHAEVPLGVLALEAAREAIADAGILPESVDGVASVPELPADMEGALHDGVQFVSANLLAHGLGISPRWGENSHIMVGNSMVAAVRALEAGACSYALVVRALHSPMGAYGEVTSTEVAGDAQFVAPYGMFAPGDLGQMWSRYQDRYASGTREQMATFVTQARAHGLLNPNSYWAQHKAQALTVDEYLDARMISSPLSLYDCDLPIQAAGAFLLTTTERAADSERPAAYVHGVACPLQPLNVWPSMGVLDFEEERAALLGEELWADAGITPSDLDVADLYDGFSILAFLWLEGLGIAPRGQGFEFIQNGRTTFGGELPLNLGGGNLGAGRTHGVPHLMDAIAQVMGRAGDAQIDGASFSLAAVGVPSFGSALVFGAQPVS